MKILQILEENLRNCEFYVYILYTYIPLILIGVSDRQFVAQMIVLSFYFYTYWIGNDISEYFKV